MVSASDLDKSIKNWVSNYGNSNIKQFESELINKKETFWQKAGEKKALELFHAAAQKVPAYKDFLKKHKVEPRKIKTPADFGLLPKTDKVNYIQSYPLASRCWNGQLDSIKVIASSSGTKGLPNYWPRSLYQEVEAALTHELLYKNYFKIDKTPTLLLVGFPMGVYVSGVATVLPSWLLSQKYPLSIVSVGNNKVEMLKAVKTLGKNFKQIVLIGHPFFIKDVLETGQKEGVEWHKLKMGMMFCSEGFSEAWRDYVLKAAGLNRKTIAAFNTYGSSEFLLMAYETRQSIALRKRMENSPALAHQLLGMKTAPNLFQFNPALRYIEEDNEELLFTALSGLPLIRFNLHDSGKILPRAAVEKYLQGGSGWQLPFLALWGRSDYTVVFYAANIYPQHIHAALNHRDLIKKLTGKFTLQQGYYKNMDEYLEIHLELRPQIRGNNRLARHIQRLIIDKLKSLNAEYKFISENLNKDVRPKVKLWPYQNDKYFKPGLKPRYIS